MKKLEGFFDKLSFWKGFKRLGIIASIILVFVFLSLLWNIYYEGNVYRGGYSFTDGLIGITVSFIFIWIFLFVGRWVFKGFSKNVTTWLKIKRFGIGASIIMLYLFLVNIGLIIYSIQLSKRGGHTRVANNFYENTENILGCFFAMWFCLFFFRFIILGFFKKDKKR